MADGSSVTEGAGSSAEGEPLGVGFGLEVGDADGLVVTDGVAVGVTVGVGDGVTVGVAVGEGLAVGVGDEVPVGVGVGPGATGMLVSAAAKPMTRSASS